MVRLKLASPQTQKVLQKFQFQHGAVKVNNSLKINDLQADYFNSNMVRLKSAKELICFCNSSKFQFQHGAVKVAATETDKYGKALFQFQHGAVKV